MIGSVNQNEIIVKLIERDAPLNILQQSQLQRERMARVNLIRLRINRP